MPNSTASQESDAASLSSRIEDEEKEHFQRIINAFKHYKHHSLQRLLKTERYLKSLPTHHQKLLSGYQEHLSTLRVCVEHNYEIINLMVRDVANLFENVKHNPDEKKLSVQPTAGDMEKVHSTLKQIVRDWSSEGASEREACYKPILDEIAHYFPATESDPADIQILVPGAGLGRLAYEIARRGYSCQGNEFSLFMLFASNFLLNRVQGVDTYRVYPWVHQSVNNLETSDQSKPCSFPDIDPSSGLPKHAQFSMAAGDFLEVYTENDCWDCIATCFFIDCANNIVSFIEAIYNILKPGGVWINLGPLLYHFADIPGENSIEPAYDIVKRVVQGVGFVMEKEKTGVYTTYAQNPRCMLKYGYDSVFFVCKKPESPSSKKNEW